VVLGVAVHGIVQGLVKRREEAFGLVGEHELPDVVDRVEWLPTCPMRVRHAVDGSTAVDVTEGGSHHEATS